MPLSEVEAMTKKLKIYAAVAAVVLAILVAAGLARNITLSSNLLSSLPYQSDSEPYVILETKDGYFPDDLSSALTEGPYAVMGSDTVRGTIIKLASGAERCAMLIKGKNLDKAEMYAALKLPKSVTKALKSGSLPERWHGAFKSPVVKAGARDGVWMIKSENLLSPVYCTVMRGTVLLAPDAAKMNKMADANAKGGKNLGVMRWKAKGNWPAHIEICDGGMLADTGDSLRLQSAWRPLAPEDGKGPIGEAVWAVEGLTDKGRLALVLRSRARSWDTSKCIIPLPTLLSAGFNLPPMQGPIEDWPKPLQLLGELGLRLNLTEKQVRDVLSGRTIFSLGGYNRLLWFTLPGLMMEFTGDAKLMQSLVSAFWDNFGFMVPPKEVDGFEFGGAANVPFPVLGAASGDMAVLGLMSPESISREDLLSGFMESGEKAVGWALIDLARLGGALGDITKMSSLMKEDGEGTGFSGGSGDGASYTTPALDEGISDAMAHLLKKFGKTFIVWEAPLSGRMAWYSDPEPADNKR